MSRKSESSEIEPKYYFKGRLAPCNPYDAPEAGARSVRMRPR